MISSSRLYDDTRLYPAYLVLWYMYLILVSMLGVILVVIIVQKGIKNRKKEFNWKKLKKEMQKIMIIENKLKISYIRIDQMPEHTI